MLVPIGLGVRRYNYISTNRRDVPHGGIVFNTTSKRGSMLLMGDSNGSMYGKAARAISYDLGIRLNIISVEAGDPLPHSVGQHPAIWNESLSFVRQEQPDYLVLVCNWRAKLETDKRRLGMAINELRQYTRYLILITQPPELPELATRASMRNGSRPPFKETPSERVARMEANALVKSFHKDGVTVIDIEPLFTLEGGWIRFVDHDANQLYQDRSHLSGTGANLVKAELLRAMKATRLDKRDIETVADCSQGKHANTAPYEPFITTQY